jgi:hypothetical protein
MCSGVDFKVADAACTAAVLVGTAASSSMKRGSRSMTRCHRYACGFVTLVERSADFFVFLVLALAFFFFFFSGQERVLLWLPSGPLSSRQMVWCPSVSTSSVSRFDRLFLFKLTRLGSLPFCASRQCVRVDLVKFAVSRPAASIDGIAASILRSILGWGQVILIALRSEQVFSAPPR